MYTARREKKLKFKLDKVTYLGHVLNADGIMADPATEAVSDMPQPSNSQHSATYLSKFLPQLRTVA